MKKKNLLLKNIRDFITIVILVIVIVYFLIYITWVYPLHNLSPYQNKDWIKELTENLVLGKNDPSRLHKVRQYEKNIISFWYGYWFFHTKQYTVWGVMHLKNKFSKQGSVKIYYYDFSNKTHRYSTLDIDFSKIETFKKDGKIIIQYKNNYLQEIDMDNDLMRIKINTNEINLEFNLTIDDYSTNIPAVIPRYSPLKSIFDMMETKCPNEWGSDNPMIGKIVNGKLNNKNIEKGGNFWFDNFIGCNNYFLSEYTWFVLLNDDWLIYILLNDTKENIKKKKENIITLLYIKDKKNNKILSCGIDSNIASAFKTLDKIVNPKKIDFNYRKIDDFDIHFAMPNFKVDIISEPNEVSKNSITVVRDYYKTDDLNVDSLSEWDRQYYKTINNLEYTEMVTLAKINIEYNGEKMNFKDRVIVDGFECPDKNCQIFCKNNSNIRSYFA
jgi:hypothetical protein